MVNFDPSVDADPDASGDNNKKRYCNCFRRRLLGLLTSPISAKPEQVLSFRKTRTRVDEHEGESHQVVNQILIGESGQKHREQRALADSRHR